MNTIFIGVAGGTGSGKTTLTEHLAERFVSNIVCIVIALAGLITISPASLLGALLAMLPFYLCAGFGLMGGGDWRLAAAVGFVLGN